MTDKRPCDILIKDTSYLDEQFQIRDGYTIAISEGRIQTIRSAKETDCPEAAEVIDGKGLLWMPGLVDGHMHTGQQLLRGAVLDELPMIWTRIMLPFESSLTPEKMELSAGLAALEMIKNGTTGFIDSGSYFMEAAAEVYLQSGLRGALSYSSMDQGNFPDSIRQTTAEVLESEDSLYRSYHGKGNLKIFYSLRALMNCSEELICETVLHARERNTFFQAHMNEYPAEVQYTLQNYRLRPVEYLESLGVLGSDFIAAHGIMLSPEEKELLSRHCVKVIHCPFSNCGKGVPETPDLLQRNIRVGLGTDGAAHGGLSLWNEMKIFRSVMNAVWGVSTANPAIMPAKTILKMATEYGAAALGEADPGHIKEGGRADLISINWDQPHLCATSNRVNTLLECVCGNDVTHTITAGRLLMKNRQVLTLDEEKLLWQARQTLQKNR